MQALEVTSTSCANPLAIAEQGRSSLALE